MAANLTLIDLALHDDSLSTTSASTIVHVIESSFMDQWLYNKLETKNCSISNLGLDGCQNSVFNYTNIFDYNITFGNEEAKTNEPAEHPFSFWIMVTIAIVLMTVTIITVGGNTLVILAFIVDSKIRQPSNYFIASLATTDFLIGLVSLPFFTNYVLIGYWQLGPLLCDLWLSVDYTICLVSQYTVLLITIDRYCSVKIAALYRAWRSKQKVLWMIAMTWLVPALLFFTTIFGWEHFLGYRDLQKGECAVQFLKDPVFNTALIIFYYWITLFVLIYLYGGIYKTASEMQKKSEAKQRKMQSMVALSAGAMSGMAGRAAGISGLSKGTISSENQVKESVSHKEPASKSSLAAPLLTLGSSLDSNSSQKSSAHKSSTTATRTSTTLESDEDKKEGLIEMERSSSPAFDSDNEESPQVTLKKRPSIANLVMKTGALQLLNNMRLSGGIMVKPTPPPREEVEKPKSSLSQISEKSLLDLMNIHEVQNSNPQTMKIVSQPCVTSPTSSGIATPSEQNDISIVTTVAHRIIPPPTDFKGSILISESPPSQSDSSRTRTLRVVRSDGSTYDVLVNMDGSDLRYMEECSIIIPSPTIESPPSSITFPLGTEPSSPPTLNSGTFPSTSLLQAALLRATEVKTQPIAKSLQVKLNTEVTITASERPQPIITVVSVQNNDDQPVQPQKSLESRRLLLNLTPATSPGIEHEASSPGVSSVVDKNDSKRKFVKNLGKKLKIKTSKKGFFPDSVRQQSKSENRARKAFRTISLILGVFVVCWTPYHVLALVEGFCKNPPCVNTHLYMFSYFLCYANSPINPFCYALANQQFRKTFARLLRGDFRIT